MSKEGGMRYAIIRVKDSTRARVTRCNAEFSKRFRRVIVEDGQNPRDKETASNLWKMNCGQCQLTALVEAPSGNERLNYLLKELRDELCPKRIGSAGPKGFSS